MASEGVWDTTSDAILWAIYTDLQGSATRGAELESGQFYHWKYSMDSFGNTISSFEKVDYSENFQIFPNPQF